MKSKVILICVLLFCSKIVDSIPHSEDHVRQRVNPLSNWQVNKKVPNAQYLDTAFTQPRNVNKLTNSAIKQENNEDYYSNHRGYNYDGYGYNKGPASSPSSKELLVNYNSPANGRTLDSYPPRVESYPSHTSQVGFDHQQYRNQKWQSQNPFTNSVPSSVFIPDDERPLVTSVQEPYRGLDQYVQSKYIVPSSHRRSRQPGRSYLTREQLQYPSIDHSGVDKYVVNSATRFVSGGLVPYDSYSESQASETKTRPSGVRRHVQDFESPSEVNKAPAVETSDTLVDQSENIKYPVPYENYGEDQVSGTKTIPTGIRKHVQNSEINYETPAVIPPVTLVDQSENIRYPVPYEDYRERQVSETKSRPTGVRRHIKNIKNSSEINYETPAVESSDTLVDQSENIRYHVPYENYREGQVSETKARQTGIRKHVQNSEKNYETHAVGPPVILVDQSENIRYPVPYENYREGKVSETKTRLTGVRRHVQDFETPSEINYESSDVESPDALVDQSENIRYPVPYKNYREGQASDSKTKLPGVRRHVQGFETASEINYETPAVESPDTDQFESTRYLENSRTGLHLSNSAPVTSYDDDTPVISDTHIYSSDSRPSNLVPIINANKEATVEISKILTDKFLVRQYADRSDYRPSNSNNDVPTDITETIKVKESKHGANYAEEKAVPIETYPEDSLTPTNKVLENSESHTNEENNMRQYGSSSPNSSKQNAIHHLTSEIKELSLKSLVANPEIQHILSRTDKRYVVVHSNGDIEYMDKLPLDSQQDSKLRLVHTKRKNTDGSEGDGVLTPQLPQNIPSNIAKNPAPVDEYPWATNNQPADEYETNPFENWPAGHSHLKPLPSHEKQPADNENSKLLPPPVTQSADGVYSKLWIPNEDQPVDDRNSNQPKDDENSKSLAPNEAQPAYDVNPKPTLENQSDDNNSNSLTLDVNHPTGDDILKHWTSPEVQSRDDDSSKLLLTDANQSNDKINLTPYTRNPVHVKRLKHAYVTHPANENTFNLLLPNEAQPRDNRNSEPAHHIKPKHSNGNQTKMDDYSNPSSPNKNQPTDDINSEPSNENLSGDDIVHKLLHPYYRHHKKSKLSLHVDVSADGNKSNPLSTPEPLDNPENQPGDDNPAKPLYLNENQLRYNRNPKRSDTNENQTDDDNDSEPMPSHNRHLAHNHKSKHFEGTFLHEDDDSSVLENQQGDDIVAKPSPSNEEDKPPEDDKNNKPQKLNEDQSEGDIDSEPLSPHTKPQVHHNKVKPKRSHANLESDNDISNPSWQHENQPEDDNVAKPLTSNEDQSEVETDFTPTLLHKQPRPHHKKPKHSDMNQLAYYDNSKLLPSLVNQPRENNNPNSPKPSHGNEPADNSNSKQPPSDENHSEDDEKTKLSKPLPGKEPADDNASPVTQPEDKISKPLPTQTKQQPPNDSTTKSLPSIENDIFSDKRPENEESSKPSLSPENRSADDNDFKPLHPNKRRPAHHNKSKHPKVNKPANVNISNPAAPEKNQLEEDNGSKPKHSRVNKSVDDNNSKTSPDETQTEDDKKSKSLTTSENRSINDNNSKESPLEENQPEDDIKTKPTPISSKNGDESKFTTLASTVPIYTTTPKPRAIKKYKRKYSHRKTTTNSPVVSTTPSPNDFSEDQFITLSPIEQVTDNVSDIPTLTTTTAKPVKTSDKKDTYKDFGNKQDEAQENTKSSSEDLGSISDNNNIVQTSTTTATPSTSTSRSDNASDDKTKRKSEENEKVAVVSKENYEKDDSQTAAYNSSELLDANTDVPKETDDYSPDIPSPSLQNDVDTGDASGDNSSELEYSETDVTITVSSSTTYDSEDEIITINIEVSESTDDANSPSNDKTLVVNIDTNPDNDDDSKALQTDVSKTTKTEDCKDDHNHDDSRGENVEIDLSNLKGEPTMWIKTTNQDFIDKLIAKNDTQFDVIYFFSIENQPIIEREKETTIFCNGTVVVETTEITYAHKDDLTPTVIKTTEIMQTEDYELHN